MVHSLEPWQVPAVRWSPSPVQVQVILPPAVDRVSVLVVWAIPGLAPQPKCGCPATESDMVETGTTQIGLALYIRERLEIRRHLSTMFMEEHSKCLMPF